MIKISLTQLFDTKDKFMKYVNIYNERYRAHSDSKSLYLSVIDKHKKTPNYKDLLKDDSFFHLVYDTLESWNMNMRGAELVDFSTFEWSIKKNTEQLSLISGYRLEYLRRDEQLETIFKNLWLLFNGLSVMKTHSKIVGVSKTLHFLLPNLVMPIDRQNILALLYLGGRYRKETEKEFNDFKDIFREYIGLARHLSLSEGDVTGVGWNTSIPKIIDNAIIGFLLSIPSKV